MELDTFIKTYLHTMQQYDDYYRRPTHISGNI